MKDEERSELKEKIITEMESLELTITALEKTTKPIAPDDAIGRLTRMEAINAKSISEASLNSSRVKLAKLKRAMSRLDDPDFGMCSMCEEPIPTGRLMLMPESAMCVKCAERSE